MRLVKSKFLSVVTGEDAMVVEVGNNSFRAVNAAMKSVPHCSKRVSPAKVAA